MSDLAGRDLTALMGRIAAEKGVSLPSEDDSVANRIKEEMCYVAFDYGAELECTTFQT